MSWKVGVCLLMVSGFIFFGVYLDGKTGNSIPYPLVAVGFFFSLIGLVLLRPRNKKKW